MALDLTKENWDRAPWNRWSFQHIREVLPTVEVWRGRGSICELPYQLRSIDSLPLNSKPVQSSAGSAKTVKDWLETSFTDGFIVLYRGDIVFERYLNGMSERTLHLAQSVSKSVVASVAAILIARGNLDAKEYVTRYLPELDATAWKGATLQQVLDMTTGVRFIEDYEAEDSDIAMTDIASGWKPARAGLDAPDSMWNQILSLDKTARAHGELFQYRSIETDVLAFCMERVSGLRLPELISRELWQPLGCEESACFTVDRTGFAQADGGFNATLRDYARFGLMHLQQGMMNGQQIVPAEWIAGITDADATKFGQPYTDATPNGAYRNQFWIEDASGRAYMARGVFGQLIYIDPDHDMVAVKLSSWPEFTSVPRLTQTLDVLHQIATHLTGETAE